MARMDVPHLLLSRTPEAEMTYTRAVQSLAENERGRTDVHTHGKLKTLLRELYHLLKSRSTSRSSPKCDQRGSVADRGNLSAGYAQ